MILLYGFSPAPGLPDTSQFVTKVDCFLRFCGVRYVLKQWQTFDDLARAPRGKFPYIDDEGTIIADSGCIVRHVQQKYDDPLGELALPEPAVAQGLALRRLLEDHLYWVLCYARWLDDSARAIFAPIAFD